MKKIQLDPILGSLLTSGSVQQFTIPELRDAYLEAPGCKHHSVRAAQQFIYKNVLRLEAKGFIERLNSSKGKSIRFRLSSSFQTTAEAPKIAEETPTSTGTESIQKTLREKLNRYKVELLSALGETEEYDAICKELPQMQQDAQDLYNQARDCSSKILGKVKALESLLARQHHQPVR